MARLRHIDLERTGARVLVALTILTLLMVSVSALMQVAAQDLFAAVNAARGTGEFTSRTVTVAGHRRNCRPMCRPTIWTHGKCARTS